MSKLRLGILPIRIETARYVKPVLPEDQRLCYCGDGNIESEYHVMFICQKYHHLRQAWLSKISCPDQFSLLTPSNKFKVTLNYPNKCEGYSQIFSCSYGPETASGQILLNPFVLQAGQIYF